MRPWETMKKEFILVHLVNNGATREISLKGLPTDIKSFNIFVTNANKDMEAGKSIKVSNGQAKFTVEETSFVTLISK